MQEWARYLFVENIDTYYGWLFQDNEDFEQFLLVARKLINIL